MENSFTKIDFKSNIDLKDYDSMVKKLCSIKEKVQMFVNNGCYCEITFIITKDNDLPF